MQQITNGITGAQAATIIYENDLQAVIQWKAEAYPINTMVYSSGQFYINNAATIATDVPGTSPKWVETGIGQAPKVPFTGTVKFDRRRKYSNYQQAGPINFAFDNSGILLEAEYKVEIVTDGSPITFGPEFQVINAIDYTRNAVIFFSRQSLVEFKITAVIMVVDKSGQITPIDLDPDAETYINRLNLAGGSIDNATMLSINNFYLTAKSDGWFSKLKGLWLCLGSNTASRLVNGIAGAPDATLVSGVVSNDGIGGVINTNMIPSEVFGLSDFSYGFHNVTAIYTNNASFGCRVSNTSGISCSPTTASPGGQFFFSGPNNDVYGNTANADSLGRYICWRESPTLAKAYRNGALLFTHTAAQGAATLPNIPLALSGFNNAGTFTDDLRLLKYGWIGSKLLDSDVSKIGTAFDTLMAAIGR